MKSPRTRSEKALLLPLIFALVCAVATALSAPDSSAATAKAQPKTFASPEEAVTGVGRRHENRRQGAIVGHLRPGFGIHDFLR